MTAPTVTRAEAITAARAVLDRALDRIARDLATGRLSPTDAADIRAKNLHRAAA